MNKSSEIKLKYLANIFTGNSIPDDKKGDYEGKEIPYIPTKELCLENGAINYDNGLSVDPEDGFKIAPSQSVLMCIEGGSAGKKIGFTDRPVAFVNKLCCLHATTIHQRFLYHALGSKDFTDQFYLNLGGLIGGVSVSTLRNLYITVPKTMEDQAAISDLIDKKCHQIDTLASNVQQQIEKLKEYKQSLITEIVTRGLNPDVQMKDSGVDWIGEIPEQWSTIRVKQLLKERGERSVDGSEEPLSMSQKLGLVPTKMLDVIPNMASSFVGAKLAYVDDLVFNKLKAHLGVFSVSKYDGLVSPDYAVYYSTGKVHLKYLEYLFKTPQCISEFRKRSTGIAAGLTRLYTDGLFAIECPFPDMSEQIQIVDYLNEKCEQIDRLMAIKQAKIEKLEQYKKSLIYEYVTGKKEVI